MRPKWALAERGRGGSPSGESYCSELPNVPAACCELYQISIEIHAPAINLASCVQVAAWIGVAALLMARELGRLQRDRRV